MANEKAEVKQCQWPTRREESKECGRSYLKTLRTPTLTLLLEKPEGVGTAYGYSYCIVYRCRPI